MKIVIKKEIHKYTLGVAIYILFLIVMMPVNVRADAPHVDPIVHTVHTSPLLGDSVFRIVITISEIYYHIYVQKISFGDEGCCPKIINSYAIKDEDLGGLYSLKSISQFKWIKFDKFQLIINNKNKFEIQVFKNTYKVKKIE